MAEWRVLRGEATLRALAETAGAGFFIERELLDNLSREAARSITWEYAEKWGVVPVRVRGAELHVAMADRAGAARAPRPAWCLRVLEGRAQRKAAVHRTPSTRRATRRCSSRAVELDPACGTGTSGA